MKRLLAAATIAFVILPMLGSNASELNFKNCLVPRSEYNVVSLGAPLAKERLGNKTKVRLGVLPFSLIGSPATELSAEEKSNYLWAARDITKLSNGIVEVEFVFFPLTDSKMTFSQASQMLRQRDEGWNNWDLSKSTFGIVKEVVKNSDPVLNFSNLDGLILENKSASFGSVAEAFQFFREPPALEIFKQRIASGSDFNFHKSILTTEGTVDNAVLFGSHAGTYTIVHEILHNFGLTDLYGGAVINPHQFSAMSSSTMDLLHYEKAVLGWFPVDQIVCLDLGQINQQTLSSNILQIDNLATDRILIIKTEPRKAIIFEVREFAGVRTLIGYKLDNDARPPIDLLISSERRNIITLSQSGAIGQSLVSNDLRLLIQDVQDSKVTLQLASSEQASSNDYKVAEEKALSNRKLAEEREKEARNIGSIPAPSKTVAPVAAPKPTKYKNCASLNKVYSGGVAKSKSSKNKGNKLRLKPVVNLSVYNLNKSLDRDKDGLVCER